jgi:hypothetical protein
MVYTELNQNVFILNDKRNKFVKYYKETLPMKLRTRSILQELNEIADIRNTDKLIESRATNIINSAIHLLESIHKNYAPEFADELERRFVNSIKGQDPNKFIRGVRRIAESRKNNNTQQLNENEQHRT